MKLSGDELHSTVIPCKYGRHQWVKLAVFTGWPYYPGRLKFHDLRAVMTNRPYIVFAFFVLISKQPECRYCDGTVIERTN